MAGSSVLGFVWRGSLEVSEAIEGAEVVGMSVDGSMKGQLAIWGLYMFPMQGLEVVMRMSFIRRLQYNVPESGIFPRMASQLGAFQMSSLTFF